MFCPDNNAFMLTPPTDEAALLERARTLDAHALGQIHDRYYPAIYRYVAYRTDDSALAEDITSEVFVRLLDVLHAGQAPHTTLRGWLYGVASNLIHDHYRRRPTVPLTDTVPDAASPVDEAEDHLRRAEVRAALRRLTPEQQAVLSLRFHEGLSVEHTAEAAGKSVTAVKALQFRALQTLRQMLGDASND